jgi:hypothetical protein
MEEEDCDMILYRPVLEMIYANSCVAANGFRLPIVRKSIMEVFCACNGRRPSKEADGSDDALKEQAIQSFANLLTVCMHRLRYDCDSVQSHPWRHAWYSEGRTW